jgi:hypothetical protein
VRKVVVLGVTVIALLVAVPFAAAAGGSSSVVSGYGQQAVAPSIQVKDKTASLGGTSPSTGTLPFTGTDLGVFAAAGIVLLGVGFGLRRLGRNKA